MLEPVEEQLINFPFLQYGQWLQLDNYFEASEIFPIWNTQTWVETDAVTVLLIFLIGPKRQP